MILELSCFRGNGTRFSCNSVARPWAWDASVLMGSRGLGPYVLACVAFTDSVPEVSRLAGVLTTQERELHVLTWWQSILQNQRWDETPVEASRNHRFQLHHLSIPEILEPAEPWDSFMVENQGTFLAYSDWLAVVNWVKGSAFQRSHREWCHGTTSRVSQYSKATL